MKGWLPQNWDEAVLIVMEVLAAVLAIGIVIGYFREG